MNPDKLKDALLEIFLRDVKAALSWGDINDLPYALEKYGFSGMFTGLDMYFTKDELREAIEKEWYDYS